MKLAKIKKSEIDKLLTILSEMQAFHKHDSHYEIEDVEWSEYNLLSNMNKANYEELFKDVCAYVSGLRFEQAVFNLLTLLDNCADPDSDTLDFHPDIKKALEMFKEAAAGR